MQASPGSLRYRVALAEIRTGMGDFAAARKLLDQAEKDLGTQPLAGAGPGGRGDQPGRGRGKGGPPRAAGGGRSRFPEAGRDPAVLDDLPPRPLPRGELGRARELMGELIQDQPDNLETMGKLGSLG